MGNLPSACYTVEDLKIGMTAEKEYSIRYEDVRKFAELSGDWNPAHHDEDYAARTIFKQRVAHGMFSVIQFSGLFGMDLPGLGALWIKQSVEFHAPAFFDQTYRAVVTVTDVDVESNTVTLATECYNQSGDRIISGEGVLKPIPAKVKAKMAQ